MQKLPLSIALCLLGFTSIGFAADHHYYKYDVRPQTTDPKSYGRVQKVPVTKQWVNEQAARDRQNRYYFHDSRRPANQNAYGRSYVRGKWLDADQLDSRGNEKNVTIKDSGGREYTRVPNSNGGYDYKSPEAMHRYNEQKASEKLFGKPLNSGNYTPGRRW